MARLPLHRFHMIGSGEYHRKAMLRRLFLAASAAVMVFAQGARADEQAMAHVPPAAVTATSPSSTPSRDSSAQNLYMICAFYPKPGTCESVYQRAMKDSSISAEAVKAEYTGYARYLTGAGSLTESDKRYLRDNAIMVPDGLSAANQAGLHNVINDPGLNPDNRRAAVNNFLSRAVEAELYCGFNSCTDDTGKSGGDDV